MKKLPTLLVGLLFSSIATAQLTQEQQANIGSMLYGQYTGCMIAACQLSHQYNQVKNEQSIDKISDYCLDITQVTVKRKQHLDAANDSILSGHMAETKEGMRQWLVKNNPKARLKATATKM